MVCTSCGQEIAAGDNFCLACGQAVAGGQAAAPSAPQPAAPAPQAPVQAPQPAVQEQQPATQTQQAAAQAQQPAAQAPVLPSLYRLTCPSCGSGDFLVAGVKGSMGKSMATTLAFGAIGNLVAGANAEADWTTQPLQYKCNGCKKKFESGPLVAGQDELLSAPCNIHFERPGSFVGMAVPQIVYLNGLKIGPVGNKKSIDFPTYLKYNTLFVTDQHGVAFKGNYKFEAAPGGNIHVRFNRKFM